MFKKLTKALSTGIEKVLEFSQTQISEALLQRYPDFNEVIEVLEKLGVTQEQNAIECSNDSTDDGNCWRSMLLTIGLLYKLQKIQDTNEDNWYNRPEIFVRDDTKEKEYLHVFGFYWHLMVQVASVIRGAEIDYTVEDVQEQLNNALQTKLEPLNIKAVLANATDDSNVDDHCPDFALLIDDPHHLIVINICGTRMIPAPKMSDVFMDLYATAEPFLHGRAHRGMAIGARNILDKIKIQLSETLEQNPDYGILVTGYSLGAGICQLVAMELLQERPNVKCISYGAPLVFEADMDSEDLDLGKNLYTVVCSHDGLASASLLTVSKLLAQVRAVDNLQMRKRDMIKLLMTNVETQEHNTMKEEDDSEDDDDYDIEIISHKAPIVLNEDWKIIQDAISNVTINQDLANLTHPASNILVFKRKNDKVVTRYFDKDGIRFSDCLRLRGSMFNHHMPWSYNSLFDQYGTDQESTQIELVNSVLNL